MDDVAAERTRDSRTVRVKAGPLTLERSRAVGHSAPARLDKDHRFAVCILTEDYRDADLGKLSFPPPNLAGLVETLTDPEIGSFTSPCVLRNCAQGDLEEQIVEFFAGREPEDAVFVYLCGVAIADNDQVFFATSETRFDAPSAASLPAAFLDRHMQRCRSQSIAVVLDCTYTSRSMNAGDRVDIAAQFASSGSAMLTASPVVTHSPPASSPESFTVVTDAVITGLCSGETDTDGHHDGRITADELFARVQRHVRRMVPTRSPRLADPNGVGRNVVLALIPAKPASWCVTVDQPLRSPARDASGPPRSPRPPFPTPAAPPSGPAVPTHPAQPWAPPPPPPSWAAETARHPIAASGPPPRPVGAGGAGRLSPTRSRRTAVAVAATVVATVVVSVVVTIIVTSPKGARRAAPHDNSVGAALPSRQVDPGAVTTSTSVAAADPPGNLVERAHDITGDWSASNGAVKVVVTKVEIGSDQIRVFVTVVNGLHDTIQLPSSYFEAVDNTGHTYGVDWFSRDWPGAVPPGTVNGAVDLTEGLHPGARSMQVGWGVIFGTLAVEGGIHVPGVTLS